MLLLLVLAALLFVYVTVIRVAWNATVSPLTGTLPITTVQAAALMILTHTLVPACTSLACPQREEKRAD
jgi:hypothetical protein